MIEKDYQAQVEQVTKLEWENVLEQFGDASIYQTWDYGAVRWGAKNLSHIVLRKKGEVVSAAQVRILKIPLFRLGMAYVFYGPMWKVKGQKRCIVNFQMGLQALIDEYVVKRGLFLRLRPWGVKESDDDMESSLIKKGFKTTRGIYRDLKRTILVDLNPSEEELRKGLKKKWRQTLQRAERENLCILESFNDAFFPHFKVLFGETLKVKKFRPGYDLNEFVQMQERLTSAQRLRITICETDGKYVSGSVCSAIGDTVIGILSATGQAGRRLQAYYLLQWNEILWAKRKGGSFYDLGGINPVTNPGVYRFKAGIGGEEVTLLGVFDFCSNKLLYHATISFESALHLRNRIRNYRHAFRKRR